jgi:hypothetical protein
VPGVVNIVTGPAESSALARRRSTRYGQRHSNNVPSLKALSAGNLKQTWTMTRIVCSALNKARACGRTIS